MKKATLLGLIAILSLTGKAQLNLGFDHYTDIKVVHNSDTLRLPWAGGLNNPQFSSIDINLDGFPDIYAYERDGEIMRLFINDGQGNFSPDMHSNSRFPKLHGSFVLLRDYDGDGKTDIFSSGFNNYGIDVHKNVSDSVLKFELQAEALKYSRPNGSALYFYVAGNDLPSIDDIDGDGDLDILVQGQIDFTPYVLLYIENQSQELYGSSDSLRYRLVNPCWGRIREYVSSTGWTEYVCDTTGYNMGFRDERHGGTTLTTTDLNGDGIKDLITGDSYNEHLISMQNTLENVDAEIDLSLSDTTFPSYSSPAQVPTLPAAFMEDIDLDGVTDMLVAPNQLTAFASFYMDTSINAMVDWYYHNDGTNAAPDYNLHTKGFFSGEMIDVGARSFPATVDINGDGLLDLVIGNEGYTIYGGTAAASLTLYLNVGTAEQAMYKLEEKDLAGISELGFGFVHPAFADLDDDGDFDLLIGDDQGRLHYFKNKGVPTIYDFHLTEPQFSSIDVDLSAHPMFFDLNNDDLEDLIIGDFYGRLHYFENAGTPTEADFSKNPTIEQMGDVLTFHSHGGEATPFVTRNLDSLGYSLYFMIGSADGTILVFEPITNIYDDFVIADSIVLDATFTSVTGADLYGDFRDELLIGQRTGGLMALYRKKEIGVGIGNPAKSISDNLRVFPNPGQGSFVVELPEGLTSTFEVRVSDISGSVVLEMQATGNSGTLDLDLMYAADGVYLVSIKHATAIYRATIVKQ